MKIGGLVENSDLTMYRITSIKDEPGAAAEILKLFAQEKISLHFPEFTLCQNRCDAEILPFSRHHNHMCSKILSKAVLGTLRNDGVFVLYFNRFMDQLFDCTSSQFCFLRGCQVYVHWSNFNKANF